MQQSRLCRLTQFSISALRRWAIDRGDRFIHELDRSIDLAESQQLLRETRAQRSPFRSFRIGGRQRRDQLIG
jgi:hypothetical protein